MVLYVSPRTNEISTRQPGNNDIVIRANSGNPTLDQEDVFNIHTNKSSWQFQGVVNTLSPKARVMGADFEGVTARGFRKTSYTQEAYDEYIEFKQPKNGIY